MTDKECKICSKNFSRPDALKRHVQKMHGVDIRGMLTHGVFCSHPACANRTARYSKMDRYRNHLSDEHQIEGILKTVQFICNSYDEFLQWKHGQERKDRANFIVNRGASKLKNGVRRAFTCSRSGSYKSESSGKRQPKNSKKSGQCCPAVMMVDHINEAWTVTYYPTHYGHDNQVEHLALSDKDRLEIAGQLSEGVPPKEIVNRTRVKESQGFCRPVTLKDVRNVSRAFGLRNLTQINTGVSLTTDNSNSSTSETVLNINSESIMFKSEETTTEEKY